MTYERRYAGVGMERRGQRGANDSNSAVATYQSILGSNLVAMWHSQLGIALVSGKVDTWTDQIGGIVLQALGAATRPLYQPDGTAFGGNNVVYGTTVDASCLVNTTIPAGLIPVGSTPWILDTMRVRAVSVANIVCAQSAATFQSAGYINAANDMRLSVIGADRVTLSPFNNAVRNYSFYIDGTNANINNNGVITSGVYAGTTTAVVAKFAVNANAAGGAAGDLSHALVLVCRTPPTAGQEAAVRALATAEFPP